MDIEAQAPESAPETTQESNDHQEAVAQSQPEQSNDTPVINAPESNDNQEPSSTDKDPESQPPAEEETPEWFMKDKYKSVEEQARAGFELQKKMGKFWGSPKDDYSVEGMDGIDSNDPLIANLAPALKDIGLSQEGFSHLAKQYQEANMKMVKNFEETLKKELTTNDAHTYKEVNSWMNDNFSKQDQEQVVNNWLMTPDDFKLFNTLRLMAGNSTSVPSSNADNTIKFETSKEVENDKITYRKEIKEGLRVKDKNHENSLATRFRDARQRELRNESLAR